MNRACGLSAGIALGLGSLGGCVVDNEFYDPPGETSESATTTGDDAGSVGELTGDPGTTGEPGTTASTGTSDPQTTTASPATTDPTTGETTDGDPSICGDGIVDEEAGERCDDGDKNTNDGSEGSCTTFCLRPPEVEFVELPIDWELQGFEIDMLPEEPETIGCSPGTHLVGLKVYHYKNHAKKPITGLSPACAPLVLESLGDGSFRWIREANAPIDWGPIHGDPQESDDESLLCPLERPFFSRFHGWGTPEPPPGLVALQAFCTSITFEPGLGGYTLVGAPQAHPQILGNVNNGAPIPLPTGCEVPHILSHIFTRDPPGFKETISAFKAGCSELRDTANE